MSEDDNLSQHARALASTGSSKGGNARAQKLTSEERREIARYAAEIRWAANPMFPKETHTGILKIAGREIPCSVLDNGLRVFSTSGLSRVVGSRKKGANEAAKPGLPRLPPFLAKSSIRPFIPDDLMAPLISPVKYKPKQSGTAFGYEATLLPRICEVILDARKAGVLRAGLLVETAELLLRGFAHVGVIALVDEATGYQQERARDELNRILEAYISKELLPWTKRFPDEFFKHLYRLHDWEYKEGHHKSPRYLGKLINRLVYEQLPPGVLPELRRLNPPMQSGYRRHRHHQFLTPETGHPHLDKQIVAATTLLRIADSKDQFDRLFEKAFPRKNQQMALDYGEHDKEAQS